VPLKSEIPVCFILVQTSFTILSVAPWSKTI
jgi:hypothetical protein